MDTHFVAALLGLLVGGALGILGAALCLAARSGDPCGACDGVGYRCGDGCGYCGGTGLAPKNGARDAAA